MTYDQMQDLTPEAFKRMCGVNATTFSAMLDVLKEREVGKKKAGRPSKLPLEDQLLMTLMYWREYRTLFHIANDYGVHESTAQRIITRVEDSLIQSGQFSLPKKRRLATDNEFVVVLIDSAETPIERPKKSKLTTPAARRSVTP